MKIYKLWKSEITLKGRIGKEHYFWGTCLANLVFGLTFALVDTYKLEILALPMLYFYVPLVFCLYVRRCHDLNISPIIFPVSIALLSIIGAIELVSVVLLVFMVLLMFVNGKKELNAYGESEKLIEPEK